MLSFTLILSTVTAVQAAWSASSLEKHVDALDLVTGFVPVVGNDFIGDPHHHRTPFAVSSDGKSAYIAYLEADGDAITIVDAQEASGLVAHDGLALLTYMNMTQSDKDEYWTPTIVKKSSSKCSPTPASAPTKAHLMATLRFGDNETYAAFFRAEYYGGTAAGHGGDSIVYLNDKGELINGKYSQTQHCGHNFGIALSASKDIPFPSVCTADDGFLRIATGQATMGGKQPTIGKERPHEMFAAEAMGGTRGSYSNLARLGTQESYLLAWPGMGPNDITPSKSDIDCFNAHVASFNDRKALITWEESKVSGCDAFGCKSTYAGTNFQMVDSSAAKQGDAFTSEDVFVSGDIVKVGSKLCWPYVNMKWDSSKEATEKYGPFPEDPWHKIPETPAIAASKMSFAFLAEDGSSDGDASTAPKDGSAAVSSIHHSSVTVSASASSTVSGSASDVQGTSSPSDDKVTVSKNPVPTEFTKPSSTSARSQATILVTVTVTHTKPWRTIGRPTMSSTPILF
ncbi:hypothetical protein CC80DRAFT_566720 [Byssothecium circinans]|uniref:Uncharacterized protein n=1 Tax=Byssothecium circinans TaxID=147558 RepID=A0A6A5TR59_9PLEO|nr:hypothetical protein CC80DRAFT_566720 [Byssothecium circinans]